MPEVKRALRRFLAWLRDPPVLRTYDQFAAIDGASDREIIRLAGPSGRLNVEDVRWDVIGAAHGCRRRI